LRVHALSSAEEEEEEEEEDRLSLPLSRLLLVFLRHLFLNLFFRDSFCGTLCFL
jgi:hypothetical protein